MSKEKKTPETHADLDQLRNILYGNQSRATEQRLTDLDSRLETIRRELSEDINERSSSVSASASKQLTDTRQSLSDQINQMSADFTQRLDKQTSDLARRLAEFQVEARQRDDDLRLEMLALGAMLDKQKVGRDELGQLLIQLGTQLKKNGAGLPSKEEE